MNSTRINMHYVYNLLSWHQSLSSTFHAQLKKFKCPRALTPSQSELEQAAQPQIFLSLTDCESDRIFLNLLLKMKITGRRVSKTKYMRCLKTKPVKVLLTEVHMSDAVLVNDGSQSKSGSCICIALGLPNSHTENRVKPLM